MMIRTLQSIRRTVREYEAEFGRGSARRDAMWSLAVTAAFWAVVVGAAAVSGGK